MGTKMNQRMPSWVEPFRFVPIIKDHQRSKSQLFSSGSLTSPSFFLAAMMTTCAVEASWEGEVKSRLNSRCVVLIRSWQKTWMKAQVPIKSHGLSVYHCLSSFFDISVSCVFLWNPMVYHMCSAHFSARPMPRKKARLVADQWRWKLGISRRFTGGAFLNGRPRWC